MSRRGITLALAAVAAAVLATVAAVGAQVTPAPTGAGEPPPTPLATATPSSSAPTTSTPSPDPDTAGMDPGCSRSLVRELATTFIEAFNRGDQDALAGLFGSQFQWFTVHSGDQLAGWGTYDRAELPAYFAARHAMDERLTIRQLEVSSGQSGPLPGSAGFTFALRRTAADLPADFDLAYGKGSIRCATREIEVWAMELRSRQDPAPWDPDY